MTIRTCLVFTAILAAVALGGCNASPQSASLVNGEKRQGVSDRYIIGTPAQEKGSPEQAESPAD